jgi:tRNA G46 methylase TrmB
LLKADVPGHGIFHLKTDHADYFDFILGNLDELKEVYEVLEMTRDLHAAHPAPHSLQIPDVTLFERLFIKDGLPIHSLKIKPRN